MTQISVPMTRFFARMGSSRDNTWSPELVVGLVRSFALTFTVANLPYIKVKFHFTECLLTVMAHFSCLLFCLFVCFWFVLFCFLIMISI